eukprot:INCI7281.1.p2 GENE.INCI7281.1~~INCI7281.1.p2  ORF type:complete len:126 (+),score=18.31 INCI7281.1:58-435(+)
MEARFASNMKTQQPRSLPSPFLHVNERPTDSERVQLCSVNDQPQCNSRFPCKLSESAGSCRCSSGGQRGPRFAGYKGSRKEDGNIIDMVDTSGRCVVKAPEEAREKNAAAMEYEVLEVALHEEHG